MPRSIPNIGPATPAASFSRRISTGSRKRELGLPAWDDATPRQRRDGMCWKKPDELYNDGVAFKLTARDANGVILTLISDNYFGYCKKDVKAQISFAANLLGQCEEEHAGGAIVFPSYDLGEDFQLSKHLAIVDHTFAEALAQLGDSRRIAARRLGARSAISGYLLRAAGRAFRSPRADDICRGPTATGDRAQYTSSWCRVTPTFCRPVTRSRW